MRTAAALLGAAIARQRQEERLRDAETRYRGVVERIPAVTYVDVSRPDGVRMAFLSPQIESLIGRAPDGFLADPDSWFDLVHPDDQERVDEAARRAGSAGDPFDEEYRMRHADGHWVWVHDTSTPVPSERRHRYALLPGVPRRHHRAQGGGGGPRRGRAPVPDDGRGAAGRHLHRRADPRWRRKQRVDAVREPADRADPRLPAGAVHAGQPILVRDHAPGRLRGSARRRATQRDEPRRGGAGVPDAPRGRALGLGGRTRRVRCSTSRARSRSSRASSSMCRRGMRRRSGCARRRSASASSSSGCRRWSTRNAWSPARRSRPRSTTSASTPSRCWGTRRRPGAAAWTGGAK